MHGGDLRLDDSPVLTFCTHVFDELRIHRIIHTRTDNRSSGSGKLGRRTHTTGRSNHPQMVWLNRVEL